MSSAERRVLEYIKDYPTANAASIALDLNLGEWEVEVAIRRLDRAGRLPTPDLRAMRDDLLRHERFKP